MELTEKQIVVAAFEPYIVEVEKNGCEKCGAAKQWRIVFLPEDISLSTMYGDYEEAADLAEELNDAYAKGVRSVAPAPASAAIPKQECGHSVAHEVRAAENGELLYCDICNTRSELRDALQMEAHYKAQLELVEARNKDLQVARQNDSARHQERVEKLMRPLIEEEWKRAVQSDVTSGSWRGCIDNLLKHRLAEYRAGDAPKAKTLEQRIANHLRNTYGDHGTCDDTVAREIAELAKEQP